MRVESLRARLAKLTGTRLYRKKPSPLRVLDLDVDPRRQVWTRRVTDENSFSTLQMGAAHHWFDTVKDSHGVITDPHVFLQTADSLLGHEGKTAEVLSRHADKVMSQANVDNNKGIDFAEFLCFCVRLSRDGPETILSSLTRASLVAAAQVLMCWAESETHTLTVAQLQHLCTVFYCHAIFEQRRAVNEYNDAKDHRGADVLEAVKGNLVGAGKDAQRLVSHAVQRAAGVMQLMGGQLREGAETDNYRIISALTLKEACSVAVPNVLITDSGWYFMYHSHGEAHGVSIACFIKICRFHCVELTRSPTPQWRTTPPPKALTRPTQHHTTRHDTARPSPAQL